MGDVWVLHMDDDTGVGPGTAQGVGACSSWSRPSGERVKTLFVLPRGCSAFPREYAGEPADLAGERVRALRYRALSPPQPGVAHHTQACTESCCWCGLRWRPPSAGISAHAAIVEDAQFALIFCSRYPGRSAWFGGRCYGASPVSIADFIRQRERWCWGLVALAFNRSIRFRYRAYLAYAIASWVAGPLQNLIVVLAISALPRGPKPGPPSRC